MSDYCGFNVNVESSGVLSQFVTEHLKYCGISNANYIENFIATVSLCDNVYTTDGVTIENPEVYLKKLVFHYLMRLIDFGR